MHQIEAVTTLTWTGAASSSMVNPSNWNPAQIPTTGDNLTFPAGKPLTLVNDIGGNLQIGTLAFADAYSMSGNSFIIPSETGQLLSFTSSGANIANTSMFLQGTWQVVSTAGGNTLGMIINGATGANLFLENGLTILSGNNTYSGLITLGSEASLTPQAILRGGAANALGSVAYPISMQMYGTGQMQLNGNNSTLEALSGNPNTTIQLGGNTLTVVNSSYTNAYYGVISGNGGLTSNVGTLALMGTNTYTGTTTIGQAGALYIMNPLASSGITIAAGGGTLGFGQNTTISTPVTLSDNGKILINEFDVTMQGSFTGSSILLIEGRGVLTLTGANGNAGVLNLSGPTVVLNSTSLGSATGITFVTQGATLRVDENLTIASGKNVTISSPATFNPNGAGVVLTINSDISGAQPLILDGLGTLVLGSTANAYTGKMQLNKGTLSMGATNVSADYLQMVFAGEGLGIFQPSSAFPAMTQSVVMMSSGTINAAGANNVVISGVVAGNTTSTITKTGSAILTLSGTNIYTGPTQVTAGTLRAGSAAAFGSGSAITVGASGTLDLNNVAVTGVGSLNTLGTVSSNFSTASASPVGTLATTGSITVAGTLLVTNTGGFSPDAGTQVVLLQSSGTGKLLSGTFATTTIPFGIVRYDYSDNQVILSVGGCDGFWQTAGNGNWAATANWDGGCAPGVAAPMDEIHTATFPTVAASTVTATLANSAGNAAQPVTLYDITFNSATTSYTIQQFDATSIITFDKGMDAAKPQITNTAGTHQINAPIVLNTDSRFSLNAGTLTLGSITTITGSDGLDISESLTSGTLINQGSITPSFVNIEGATFTNTGTVNPSGTITIAGLNGIVSPATVNNTTGTMTAGGAFIIGGTTAASTVVTNSNRMSATTGFSIASGTVTNNGQMFSGGTFTITGGTTTNASGATLGTSTAPLLLSSGTLATSGIVNASNFTPSDLGILQINVQSPTVGGVVNANGTVVQGGSLVVNALSGFNLPSSQRITLITAKDGFHSSFASTSFTNFPSSFIPNLVYTPTTLYLDAKAVAPSHHASTAAPTHLSFSVINQHNAFLTRKAYQMRSRFKQRAPRPVETAYVALEEVVVEEEPIEEATSWVAQNVTESIAEEIFREKVAHILEPTLAVFERSACESAAENAAQDMALKAAEKKIEFAEQRAATISGAEMAAEEAAKQSAGKMIELSEQRAVKAATEEVFITAVKVAQEEAFVEAKPWVATNDAEKLAEQIFVNKIDRIMEPVEELLAQAVEEQKAAEIVQEDAVVEEPALADAEIVQEDAVVEDLPLADAEIVQFEPLPVLTERVQKQLPPWRTFFGPITSFGHVDAQGSQVGLGAASVGGMAGFDVVVPDLKQAQMGIGFAIDYRRQWSAATDNGGDLTTDKLHASLYNTLVPDAVPNLAIDGVIGFAYAWDSLERNTGVDNSLIARGNTGEAIFDILGGLEYTTYPTNHFSIIPLLHVQYATDSIGGYQERDAGIYNLKVSSQTIQSLLTSLGSRFVYEYAHYDTDIRIEFDAEWQHEFLNNDRTIAFTPYNLTSSPTYVSAFGSARNGLLVALDMLITYPNGLQLEGSGTFQWNSLAYETTFYLGLGKQF